MMKITIKKSITLTAMVAVIGVAGLLFGLDENQAQTNYTEIRGSMENYSVDFLAQNTPYAIVGLVKQITPIIVEDEGSKRVFSDITLDVQKDLNGNYKEKQITVRISGGSVDGITTVSDVDADFQKNERVLIFVAEKEPDSIWGDNYYVAGLYQGKFKLSNGNAYGHEFENGIVENDLIAKIQKARSLN